MCGRYVIARATADLLPLFDIDQADENLPSPSFNIAPTQSIRIVLQPETREPSDQMPPRRLCGARWGLVPAYATSLTAGPTPFNARLEKLLTSPMYSGPYRARRAVIPADGFFERCRTGARQSFYIHPADDQILAFAGLYQWWANPALPADDPNHWLLSATIITGPPHPKMATIHDREPLYLHQDLWDDWLDPNTPGTMDLLNETIDASADIAGTLDFRPISGAWLSTRPGNRQDSPELVAAQPGPAV